MKNALSVCLLMLLIAFLLLSPAVIAGGVEKNIFSIRKEEKKEEYKGTIVFWHVVSFKTGKGSGYSLLKARCSRFERSTPYVFIDLFGLTAEEAKKKMEVGERPDIISFPKGFLEDEKLVSLDKGDIPEPIGSAFSEKEPPYMFDSYMLIVNSELFYRCDIQLPFEEQMTEEVFYTAMERIRADSGEKDIYPLSYSDIPGLDIEKALRYSCFSPDGAGLYQPAMKSVRPDPEAAGREVFLSGRSAMHLCPYSEYMQISEDKRADALSLALYPASDYTDIVQCVSVLSCKDSRKEEMCARLAGSLIREGFQSQLETIDMLPVLSIKSVYESDWQRRRDYDRLLSKGEFK